MLNVNKILKLLKKTQQLLIVKQKQHNIKSFYKPHTIQTSNISLFKQIKKVD
ncbi:hypothetical protein GCM10022271_08700 [Corallibacter vietnamensis]|uniref:Uncharacterized protein n=1 Tax=Corallibacter vietnamensis TaxID=904130 RepID=A0ABP7GZL9_9FLAO